MNDKTAIETIRALRCNAENDMPAYDFGWDAAIDKVLEAIAALDAEKQGEDAEALVYQWQLDCKRDCELESRSELAARIDSFAASYHAEQCKACNKWISVNHRLPENCNSVLVFGINESGKSRKAKAMYARKFELEANDEAVDSGFFEYDEARDESYVPEGWYEDNSCSETDYVIDFTVTHWQPLPESPIV